MGKIHSRLSRLSRLNHRITVRWGHLTAHLGLYLEKPGCQMTAHLIYWTECITDIFFKYRISNKEWWSIKEVDMRFSLRYSVFLVHHSLFPYTSGSSGLGVLTIKIRLFIREIASRLSAFRNDNVRSLNQTNLSCQYSYLLENGG